MADEQLAVGVPAVDLAKEPIEPLDGQVASNSEVLEDQADLGQTQVGSTQQADELACTDLTGVVAPISAGLINARGAKKSDPVGPLLLAARRQLSPKEWNVAIPVVGCATGRPRKRSLAAQRAGACVTPGALTTAGSVKGPRVSAEGVRALDGYRLSMTRFLEASYVWSSSAPAALSWFSCSSCASIAAAGLS